MLSIARNAQSSSIESRMTLSSKRNVRTAGEWKEGKLFFLSRRRRPKSAGQRWSREGLGEDIAEDQPVNVILLHATLFLDVFLYYS